MKYGLAIALPLMMLKRAPLAVALPPVNTGLPFVTGVAKVGNTLTTTDGTWDNSPTYYTYRWYRGPDVIPGETGNVYTCTVDDVGFGIKSEVTAGNSGGEAVQQSNFIGPVQP